MLIIFLLLFIIEGFGYSIQNPNSYWRLSKLRDGNNGTVVVQFYGSVYDNTTTQKRMLQMKWTLQGPVSIGFEMIRGFSFGLVSPKLFCGQPGAPTNDCVAPNNYPSGKLYLSQAARKLQIGFKNTGYTSGTVEFCGAPTLLKNFCDTKPSCDALGWNSGKYVAEYTKATNLIQINPSIVSVLEKTRVLVGNTQRYYKMQMTIDLEDSFFKKADENDSNWSLGLDEGSTRYLSWALWLSSETSLPTDVCVQKTIFAVKHAYATTVNLTQNDQYNGVFLTVNTPSPTTGRPTNKPTTGKPTTGIPTLQPTTGIPTTMKPTTASPTKKPTRQPTTRAPTRAPVMSNFFDSVDGSIDDTTGEYLKPIYYGKCDMSNSTRMGNRQGGPRGIGTTDQDNESCVSSCTKQETCVVAQFIPENPEKKCILVTACDVVQHSTQSFLTYKRIFTDDVEVRVFPEMISEGNQIGIGREVNITVRDCVVKCIKDRTCEGVLYNPIYLGSKLMTTCTLFSKINKIKKFEQTYNLTERFDDPVTPVYNFMVTYRIRDEGEEPTQSPSLVVVIDKTESPVPKPPDNTTSIVIISVCAAVIVLVPLGVIRMKKRKKRVQDYALIEQRK